MKHRSHYAPLTTAGITLSTLVLLAAWGCSKTASSEPAKATAPAKVEAPVKEADLTKVRLTEAAERRLGIQLAAVERKAMPLTRLFGGTVVVPQGGAVSLSSPLAGTLVTSDMELPRPGARVTAKQLLLKLAPVLAGQQEVLSPSDRLSLAKAQADLAASRAEAEGQVKAAEAQLAAARARLDRADRLRRERAGSEQAYEEALAATRKAEADFDAAKSRLQVLAGIRLQMQPESAPALDFEAPLDGIVSVLHVRGGQEVPAGAPLVDVTATDPLWVRVPIYVGELGLIAPTQGARVRRPGDDVARDVSVKQTTAAPVGNASAASVDLFFELPNRDMTWLPDEKVIVRIPLSRSAEALVVPWSAVVHDVHGGAWVYVKSAPQTYARERVEVREVVEDLAIIERGPKPDTQVVTAGAAELFGTEFGAGK